MKKTFLLIAKDNSYGLVREANVIAEQLEAHGYKVERATPRGRSWVSRLTRKKHADVIIFFEKEFCSCRGLSVSAMKTNIENPE